MRLKSNLNVLLICVGLLFVKTASAVASTATTTILVTASVLSVCTIAATPLPFGVYSSAAISGTATLTVTCTLSTPYSVGLDAGTGSGSTTTTRKMTNGSNSLSYQLFRDAGHTLNFGQTSGTDTSSGNGSGLAQLITIYGQILPSQNAAPGAYTDTVTATITY